MNSLLNTLLGGKLRKMVYVLH
jgi:hypothetical protein